MVMNQQGILITNEFLHSLIQECTKKKDVAAGRRAQSVITSHGLDSDAFWGDHLIRMFTSCGSILDANRAFCKVSKPSIFTWSAIISAHAKLGSGEKALELYHRMQQEGINPDKITLLSTLKACKNLGALGPGMSMQDRIIRNGYEVDVVVSNTLIDMYAKCGSLEEARNIFDNLSYRDVVSWSAVISGYAANGSSLHALELFKKMQEEGIKPDRIIFLFVLKACGSIGMVGQVRPIHEQLIRTGFESDIFIGSSLLDIYAKCGCVEEARIVFDMLPNRNAVSWASMISGYAQHGHDLPAIDLLEEMQQDGIDLDRVAFLSILKACGSLGAIRQGRWLHNQIIKIGLQSDTPVGNTLVHMYAKCGNLDEAHKVFEGLLHRDVVSWGAIIAGYADHGCGLLAFEHFCEMQQAGTKPNMVIFLCVLKACSSTGAIEHGKLIHEHAITNGFESDVAIGNALVDMYVKCGWLEDAQKVFNEMPYQDVVSWGAIIAGCAQQKIGPSALALYEEMQEDGIDADKVIYLGTLKACGTRGAVEQGRLIHGQIIESGLELELVIGNTLVDMYSKCGILEDARKVFNQLPSQDLVSWAAMITGYAQGGNFRLAGQCLKDMVQQNLQPHDGIFGSILVACSHAGVLEEGCHFFKLMVEEHGIMPTLEHYNCIIDLLSRAGHLNEAVALLESMPVPPDVIIWTSVLTSCRTYHNVELGRRCFDKVVQWDPDDASGYMLMSNIYADAHMREDVDNIQELRRSAGAQKKRGTTWIEVDSKVHEFIVGEKSHSKSKFIFCIFKRLSIQMKRTGYMPQLALVFEPAVDEDTTFLDETTEW